MQGILIINKPKGYTSQDVVSKVKKILNIKKAGHTGTLDPLATGVLPIMLGDYTKLSKYLVEHNKTSEHFALKKSIAGVEVVKRFALVDNLFKLRPRRIFSDVAIKIFPVNDD